MGRQRQGLVSDCPYPSGVSRDSRRVRCNKPRHESPSALPPVSTRLVDSSRVPSNGPLLRILFFPPPVSSFVDFRFSILSLPLFVLILYVLILPARGECQLETSPISVYESRGSRCGTTLSCTHRRLLVPEHLEHIHGCPTFPIFNHTLNLHPTPPLTLLQFSSREGRDNL